MKKLFVLPILCAAFSLMESCTSCKDDDGGRTENYTYTTSDEFIAQHRDDMLQEFTFDNTGASQTFALGSGSTVTVQPGTFLDTAGNPIEGNIAVEIMEMRPEQPSAMIFSGTNTNLSYDWNSSGPRYLESDGYLSLNAYYNGEPVNERLGANMTINLKTGKEDGAQTELWTAPRDEEVSSESEDAQFAWNFFGEEDMVWGNERDPNAENQQWNTVTASAGGFEFNFGKLGWVNVDVLWGIDAPKTTVTVSLTGNVGTLAEYMGWRGDTYVFFVGKGFPVVAQLYTRVDQTTVKSYDDSMPVGAKGKMIAFSVVDGVFSYASQDITIEEDMSITLDLRKVTRRVLEDAISSLDGFK